MEFSGERYLPEITDFQISYEHWHRYLYATNFSKGKTVLDIACGEGYGAFLLAGNAAQVTGIDIDNEAILRANQNYSKENLTFLQGSITRIPVKGEAKFDLIVSFETIEHVGQEQQEEFMREVKRLLKPGGIFIISTPDKFIYSELPGYRNEFHVKEFYADEFTSFLKQYFDSVEVLGQDIYTSSYIHSEAGTGGLHEYNLTLDTNFKPQKDTARHDAYMVAVCADENLPQLPSSLLFNSKNKRAEYNLSYQVLYVDTGNGFNETETLLMNVQEKNKPLVFDLSGFPGIENLRFDPTACPVYLKINGVTIESADGQYIAVAYSTNATQQESPFFLFDMDDPQVFLDLPVAGNFKTVVFDLEYVAVGAAIFPYLINFTGQQISEFTEKSALLESLLADRENEVTRISKELQTSGLLLNKTEEQLVLQKRLTEMAEAYSAEIKPAINALTKRLSDSEELIKLKEEQLRQLAESLNKAMDSVKVLEGVVASKDAGLQSNEERILLLLNQVDNSLRSIVKLQSSVSQKEEIIAGLEAELTVFEARLVQSVEEKSVLSQQFEKEQARLRETLARLNETQSRYSEVQLALNETQSKYSEVQLALNEAQSRYRVTQSTLNETQSKYSEVQSTLNETQSKYSETRSTLNEVQLENTERGKYIEYLNGFVGELENSNYEKDGHIALIQQDSQLKAQYIGELKNSLSFRLGWMLTAPFRQVYEGLKLAFWGKFMGIVWKYPRSFFKNFNLEKIAILRQALKKEPPSLILGNFIKLLTGSTQQMTVVQKKEDEKLQAVIPNLPVEAIESKEIHYFIDQLEELDFHFSIRGWIFSESHQIKSLCIAMSQGNREVISELFYHIDRPDVYHHYTNKNALRSGFFDSIEKPFNGKARLNLVATFADGTKSVTSLGETEFREPFLKSFGSAILANRAAFLASNGKKKSGKGYIALYTNSGGNYFFNEIKALVAKGFRSLGYKVLELDETDGFDNDALLHIVIAPHEFFEIGEGSKFSQKPSNRMILLNTEQPGSFWFRNGTAYFPHAIDVWDMNFYSWQRLHETLGHAHFLPLGFVKNFDMLGEVRRLPDNYFTCFLDEKIRKKSFLYSKFEDRPIDILFVGHASPRRQQFFATYAAFFSRFNCYFHLTDLSLGPVKDATTNLNTRTAIGLAQRSKIILNIHHGTHQYFEWHRIVMHGIWQRGLVISDLCGDGPPFKAGRDFIQVPLDELPEKIAYFLETSAGNADANAIIHSASQVLTTRCDLAVALDGLMASTFEQKTKSRILDNN